MMLALWPNGKTTPGPVWHRYGPRKPIQTPNGPTSSFHGGIDIGPWDGWGKTWLLAPADGVVTRAAYDSIFGNRVIVEAWIHGDRVEFWLCHGRNNTMQVRKGDRVRQLDRLMLMGETGKAVGEHVHKEVHVNGVRVDPEVFYRDLYARPAGGGSSIIPTGGKRRRRNMSKAVVITDHKADKDRQGVILDSNNNVVSRFGWFPLAYGHQIAKGFGLEQAAVATPAHFNVIVTDFQARAAVAGKVTVDGEIAIVGEG